MPPMHAEQSPDEHVHTEQRGISQVVRNIFGGSSRDVLWGAALGVSLAVNLVAIFFWRDARTESQVKDYNLTFFLNHDWVDYKVKLESDHQLIQAYWPRQAAEMEQDNGRRRSDHHQERDAKGAH
jgi:hypothetical protein